MISLESPEDGGLNDRNFEALRYAVIDTMGVSMTLRLVAGNVSGAGAKTGGAGFTVTKTPATTGIYVVVFSLPFPALPVIQFGSDQGSALDGYWTPGSAAGFTAHILSGGVHADVAWNFTATYTA